MPPSSSIKSNSSPPSITAPDFLTVEEAAALLRVNRKTLYEATRLGQVPGIARLGRVLRIRRDALLTQGSIDGIVEA